MNAEERDRAALAEENARLRRELIARRETEKILKASEAHYRAILDASADPIITVDTEGTIRSASASVERVFGWTPEELMGRSVDVLLPTSDRGRRQHYIDRLRSLGEALQDEAREVEGLRRDGRSFPCELRVGRVDVPDGTEPLFAGVVRDLSDRRALEAQLVQAQKLEAIGQLAAGIAHEINTPTQYVSDNMRFLERAFGRLMDVLDACTELVQSTAAAQVPAKLLRKTRQALQRANPDALRREIPNALEDAADGLSRIAGIVMAMKEFSHPGGREHVLIDVNRALSNTVTVAHNEWKYVAEVEWDVDSQLPRVWGYPAEMNQAFLNLIVNAAHAIGEVNEWGEGGKGVIRVRTTHREGWVEVHIEDTGSGIPEEDRDRVFDPFFTTKDVGRGTGQGLAIVRSVIVDRHGGLIDFESKPGGGTIFVVRLPVQRDAG